MQKKVVEMKRFFSELSPSDQQLLLKHGYYMTAEKGKVLFCEGDEPKYIYLVKSGQVSLSKMTQDGKEFFVHLKQKDELVGEVGLFNEMAISVTAKILERSELVRFERTQLEELFCENGQIAMAFMKWFTRHTQSTQAKFRDLLLCGKTGAIYSILIRFCNSYGIEHQNGTKINVNLTNQELANFIGATRESVNRLLNDLKKENIIEIDQDYIVVKKLEYLKDYLHCGDCPVEICTI